MSQIQLKFEEIRKHHLKEISELDKNRLPVIILADGVNDIGNLAMLFRLADALRIKKIILFNLKDNFNFKLLKKKSRNTTKYVPYEIVNNITEIKKIKENNFFTAVEKTNKSINYSDFIPEIPVCVIIGSEKFGISEDLLNLVDVSVHLPMNGINTSINAATAAAVVLYDFHHKIKLQKNEKFHNK